MILCHLTAQQWPQEAKEQPLPALQWPHEVKEGLVYDLNINIS
jgi:hypothetical protein